MISLNFKSNIKKNKKKLFVIHRKIKFIDGKGMNLKNNEAKNH